MNTRHSFAILRDAGMEKVDIGIDSGIERFHDIYETGNKVKDNIEILKIMNKHRLNFDISFIFFDPYLNLDEIKVNIEFLEKISVFFSSLSQPYCFYLSSRVLNKVLILRHEMPIIEKLKQDGLVIERPDFSSHPQIKFQHPLVKKVYLIYMAINKSVFPFIRPLFNNKSLAEKYRFIELLPLKIMKKIVSDVAASKCASISDYILETASYIKKNSSKIKLHK